MKNNAADLKSRGFVSESDFPLDFDISKEKIDLLLNSEVPINRTKAAYIIKENKYEEYISKLIKTLKNEKKLYCKIALCEALSAFGGLSIAYLIPELSKIGKNQHKTLPAEPFNKSSYPLPRDIIARTLITMGIDVIEPLINEIEMDKINRKGL